MDVDKVAGEVASVETQTDYGDVKKKWPVILRPTVNASVQTDGGKSTLFFRQITILMHFRACNVLH